MFNEPNNENEPMNIDDDENGDADDEDNIPAVLLVRHRVHLVLLVVRRGSSALRLVGHRQRLLLGRLK